MANLGKFLILKTLKGIDPTVHALIWNSIFQFSLAEVRRVLADLSSVSSLSITHAGIV